MSRLFAIGDIHGCLDKLDNLLEQIPVNWERDKVIFLGDYIDRGPDPKGVVQRIMDLKAFWPNSIVPLKGNHEEMFLAYMQGDHVPFISQGGDKTIESYTDEEGHFFCPPEHIDFLQDTAPFFTTEHFIFVHAGLKPGIPLEEQNIEDLLWIRSEFINSSYDWGRRVIFGHTPFNSPLIQKNKVGIDTGAVYGGRLTCLVLPDFNFIFS